MALRGRRDLRALGSQLARRNRDRAAPMNQIPKVVFSKSLTSADWAETTIANRRAGGRRRA